MRPYGFIPFPFGLTFHLKPGKNILVVLVIIHRNRLRVGIIPAVCLSPLG